MEACNTSPLPNPLPEVIKSEDPLWKRRMDYWVMHAHSLFVKLFKSTNSPDVFQVTSDYLLLKDLKQSSLSSSSLSSTSSLLNQAQIFEKCSNQMHVALNIVYAAWGLREVIENRDEFLVSTAFQSVTLSDRFIRRLKFWWTMGKMG